MKALLTQVRFNVAANSVKLMKAARMGVKTSTVKWVTVLVFIFEAYCGTEIYITICHTFELCVVSIDVILAFNLLLLANSALNPLVYAFLKEDIKRETKILFCRRRHFIKPPSRLFQVHPE